MKICERDEGYSRVDAEEIGWCADCRIPTCSKNKNKDKNLIGNDAGLSLSVVLRQRDQLKKKNRQLEKEIESLHRTMDSQWEIIAQLRAQK